MLNSRILGLNSRGTASFVVNDTTIFLPGECELPNAGDPFFDAKLQA